ncbi:probable tyrosyl-DNA phosphodiesterase [Tenebrio molitor]|uniref:probable tyrosyl-DNA phosphodiesterase n=1 Tax=Tenebrio molitor TaxID=7067 RepID=UPI0036249F38
MEEPLTMLEKLERAAPYNVFFNTIPDLPDTLGDPDNVNFADLLCPSLGQLKCSLQLNFIINPAWLMDQYNARALGTKPLTIVYGLEGEGMEELMESIPNLTYHFVEMTEGIHHSKIGIYVYQDDSLRVVVSTANLYEKDWTQANESLWVSPLCRRLPETASDTDGDSPTGFKSSLLRYLKQYNLPILEPWVEQVGRADFRDVRVFLVTSIPGEHCSGKTDNYVYHVGDLLAQHCTIPSSPLEWEVIAQTSSVGFFGKTSAKWLRGILLRSLAAHDRSQKVFRSGATFKLVYPSVRNVQKGRWSEEGSFCLVYEDGVHRAQKWFKGYLHEWRADRLGRSGVMPHTKSYCRTSPCHNKMAWFLLTSANVSRAAWGRVINDGEGVFVKNYEAGVMFLPKFFDEDCFEIGESSDNKNVRLFPFLFDLPLTEYKAKDHPWCT